MINRLLIAFLMLLAIGMVACEDDTESFDGPYQIVISGPTEVEATDVENYTIGDYDNPDSYTWSIVEGPASIVGNTTGNTVSIEFSTVGDVVIRVSNGSDAGNFYVTVTEVDPMAEVELAGTGVLRSGQSDTVFFNFDAPLAQAPSVKLVTADDSTEFNGGEPFISGSLGDLTLINDSQYYVIYTAGDGNGTAEVLLLDLISTAPYGSKEVDSLYLPIFQVDNIDPIANVDYSAYNVNDSTEVEVTVTFSEPVMFADPADSALLVTFSGAGVATVTDSLMATDDPLVYTYTFTVNGEGAGNIDVVLSNITDLAGNPLADVEYMGSLFVDNIAPIVIGTATDEGDYVRIEATASEAAQIWYLIQDATDADVVAPTTAAEFMEADGVLSGTVNGSTTELLSTGSYNVYFLAQDTAGNYSNVASTTVTMD